MNTRRSMSALLPVALVLSLTGLLAGCGDDDPATPAAANATADGDAANALAADVGADSGGVADQLADLATAVAGLGAGKTGGDSTFIRERFHETVWDLSTGTWTITVARERGFPEGTPYATMSRVYTLRMLNADGEPQQYRIVGADTARTAEFTIVSGTGYHRSLLREHTLNELSGNFLVTGVNTDLLTVNGTYRRGATNHIETVRFERTLTGLLNIELVDVTVPRALRLDFSDAVSGTLTGTYVADITVTRGDDYSERHLERDINIVLGGGEAEIHCGGGIFHGMLGSGRMGR